MNIKIKEYSYHRNGVSGNGFYAIIFLYAPDGGKEETFLATLFDETGSCAVVSLDRIETQGIAFGDNSWRGDYFEDELREIIEAEEKNKEVEI